MSIDSKYADGLARERSRPLLPPEREEEANEPTRSSNLRTLQRFGQSVWLDYLRRSLLTSGELRRLIDEDGLRGLTSNPSIFAKAIAEDSDYRESLDELRSKVSDPKARYEKLAVHDIRNAADALRGIYTETAWRDGYVSLEVSPLLAYDEGGTIEEAFRLWRTIDRENVMIKVPATAQGIAAIRELVGSGINVNATLLFSQDSYAQVADAYIAGLERWVQKGEEAQRVASVASFFVSRIDAAVDARIEERLQTCGNAVEKSRLRDIAGTVAIANAKLAYQRYLEIVRGPRWEALAKRGARTQRLLWASTGAKNPNYRDVIYVEELIAPNTINTMPPATLEAFRDHGRLRTSLTEDIAGAHETLNALVTVGISLQQVADQLLDEGVQLFARAFRELLDEVAK